MILLPAASKEECYAYKIAYEVYYELSFNMAGSVNMAYGTSLDAMDDVIEAQ